MSDDKPFLAQCGNCGVRRRYGVDHIRAIAQHVEIGVAAFRSEASVIRANHGVTHEDILIEAFPVIEQRLHEGGSATSGYPARAMRPSKKRPPTLRRRAVRH